MRDLCHVPGLFCSSLWAQQLPGDFGFTAGQLCPFRHVPEPGLELTQLEKQNCAAGRAEPCWVPSAVPSLL